MLFAGRYASGCTCIYTLQLGGILNSEIFTIFFLFFLFFVDVLSRGTVEMYVCTCTDVEASMVRSPLVIGRTAPVQLQVIAIALK